MKRKGKEKMRMTKNERRNGKKREKRGEDVELLLLTGGK